MKQINNNFSQINDAPFDALIIGGGIAGLFTLARLLDSGYRAVLFEKSRLGAKQTLASQGIIHGGTKYSLLGKKTNAQKQIAEMPHYWRKCLAEQGEVNLSTVKVLCDNQLMWARNDISSKVTGFFASRAMQSKVSKVDKTNLPKILQQPTIAGNFYALDEPVLDVDSLIQSFKNHYGNAIYEHTIVKDFTKLSNSYQLTVQNGTETRVVNAQKIVLCVGEANQMLAEKLGIQVSQQLRPLRMVSVTVPKSYGAVFIHILEMSDKPRLTISTKTNDDEHYSWYLGGNLAEKGISQTDAELITSAKAELTALFPWLDFSDLVYDIIDINRAEGVTGGKRPDTPVLVQQGNVLIGWPTKLAMAPVLANQILTQLKSSTD